MTPVDSSSNHHSQWTPKLIELRVHLSPKSLNPQCRFSAHFSNGYIIPSPCLFTVTSRDNSSFRILMSTKEEKPISFHAEASLIEVSTICSKLNMAIALSCLIVANLEGNYVVFKIKAPTRSTEETLVRHFDICEGKA